MTALWPQSWFMDDLQATTNRKILRVPNFCSSPRPSPSQGLIHFASTYLRRHPGTLQLLQVMTHRLYTFTNCVLLLLVLNIVKLTIFCIVGSTLMTLIVGNSNSYEEGFLHPSIDMLHQNQSRTKSCVTLAVMTGESHLWIRIIAEVTLPTILPLTLASGL